MKQIHPVQRGVEVDEHWLVAWCEFGMIELTDYLAKVARFEQYLKEKEKQ